MRIAILTLPLRLNYGGILQAYALQTVLTRMGHDVKVVYNSPYRNERLFIQIYHALRHIVYSKTIIQELGTDSYR